MEDVKSVIGPDASRLLAEIRRILSEKGVRAYIVGGFVRDVLLGRVTGDIDIALSGDALTIADKIARGLGAKCVPLDTENGVARVIPPDKRWEIDFTTLNGDIGNDLARRDFTIDALAVSLDDVSEKMDTGSIIDPFNGMNDLQRKMVRAVGDNIFRSDPVRLLRAVRLSAELGFEIDSQTEELIRRDSKLVFQVAGERVREELLRLLAVPGTGRRLSYMDRLGLLTALVPELLPARGTDQPHIHYWDVLDHSIETVASLEFILRQFPSEYAGREVLAVVPWSGELEQHFDSKIGYGSTRLTLLKLAALLHDIAKPQTRTIDKDGRARFLGHPLEGAAESASIMERLRFSNRETKLVECCIKYHMRPTQMSNRGLPTRRAVYRFFRDTGEAGIDILFLCLADHLATRGPLLDLDEWQYHSRMTEYVLNARNAEEGLTGPPRLLDGNDIMEAFGLLPGPQIGGLLEALHEAQAAGEVTGREQALKFIGCLLTENTPITNDSGEENDQK
jgi:poly(A) polymerase